MELSVLLYIYLQEIHLLQTKPISPQTINNLEIFLEICCSVTYVRKKKSDLTPLLSVLILYILLLVIYSYVSNSSKWSYLIHCILSKVYSNDLLVDQAYCFLKYLIWYLCIRHIFKKIIRWPQFIWLFNVVLICIYIEIVVSLN